MIEKELRHYLLSIPTICELVKDHIYAGRVPKTAKPLHAILLRRIAGSRTYGLYGEDDVTTPVIQVDLLSRHASAEVILERLFDLCRRALNKYSAAPGKMGSVWVTGLQIASEIVDVPLPPVAQGQHWKRQRSFDVEIMHEQEVTLA